VSITPKPIISQPKPCYDEPAATEPSSIEPEPVIVPHEAVPQKTELLKPEPLPEASAEEFPAPVPAPPAEVEAMQTLGNPFLRVSQIEELEQSQSTPAVDPFAGEDAASEQPRSVEHNLSQPWADALGLPAKAPEPIEQYHRN
jgi:hypothetical protein